MRIWRSAKGLARLFFRSVLRDCLHERCGRVTRALRCLYETYDKDSAFNGSAFCGSCDAYFPVSEFVWEGTDEQAGDCLREVFVPHRSPKRPCERSEVIGNRVFIRPLDPVELFGARIMISAVVLFGLGLLSAIGYSRSLAASAPAVRGAISSASPVSGNIVMNAIHDFSNLPFELKLFAATATIAMTLSFGIVVVWLLAFVGMSISLARVSSSRILMKVRGEKSQGVALDHRRP